RPMGALEGKVAVITGGGSGIGAATVRLFATEGASVLIGDVDDTGSAAVAAAASAAGAKVAWKHTDVARSGDVRDLFADAVARWGRLDIAFNNAGVAAREGGIAQGDEDEFDRIVAVDLKGVYLGIKHAIPHLIASGGGA